MSDLILFWHRRDLRISDNTGLVAARKQSPKIVGVFCLDPEILSRDDIASVRVTYMLGCLQALQTRYNQLNSQLLILHNNPIKAIPALAQALGVRLLL
jgi:deoxyribodipyrimidine photo-lyase